MINSTIIWQERFDNVTLDCPLRGKPPAVLSWHYNNTLIKAENSLIYEIDPSDISLTIYDLDEPMQGLYTCHAVNEFGATRLDYYVQIFGKYILKNFIQ